MMELVVTLAVVVILAVLIYWILGQFPMPEPISKIVNIVLVVVFVLILISLLLSFAGHGPNIRLLR